MNGIEKIINKIEADTQSELELLRQNADSECAQVASEWEKVAADEYSELARQYQLEAETGLQRKNSAADMDAKKQLLALKQKLITDIFSGAEQRLLSMPEEERLSFLCNLAARASASGSEQVVLSADDLSCFGDNVAQGANALLRAAGRPAALKTSQEPRAIGGGLVLVDGAVEVNCSIGTLISMSRDELSMQVAQILFS